MKKSTKAKQPKPHNEWFQSLSSKRKSCPNCHAKLLYGESIWAWGEYFSGKWRTVKHFCKSCFIKEVQGLLISHTAGCGCEVHLCSRSDYGPLPAWLTLNKIVPARPKERLPYSDHYWESESPEPTTTHTGGPHEFGGSGDDTPQPAPVVPGGQLTEEDYETLGFDPSVMADAESAGIEELELAAEMYDELVGEAEAIAAYEDDLQRQSIEAEE